MAIHGSVSSFNSNKESWTTYVERLDQYFIANEVIDDGKKRAILLSACGTSTYKLIRSLAEKEKLDLTPFKDIIKLVKGFYDPKPSEIVQRYRFNTRVRAPTESIAKFIAALRELSEHCNYGATLSEMLRDRLVCGVNHEVIQRKLLAEKDLDYEKALTLALSIETAERDTVQLKGDKPPPEQVHFSEDAAGKHPPRRPFGEGRTPTCYRCGGPHLANVCRFIEAECRYCKKKGHIAKVCRSKAQHDSKPKPKKTNNYVQEDETDDEESAYSLFTLQNNASRPIVLKVTLNGVSTNMELDTGASTSVLSEATYKLPLEQEKVAVLEPSAVQLKTYTGQLIETLGTITVKAEYMGKATDVRIQVAKGDGPNLLLGRDWLEPLAVDLARAVQNVRSNLVKYLPPARLARSSSITGRGYVTVEEAVLTVSL